MSSQKKHLESKGLFPYPYFKNAYLNFDLINYNKQKIYINYQTQHSFVSFSNAIKFLLHMLTNIEYKN